MASVHRPVLTSKSAPVMLSSSGAVASVVQPEASQATRIVLMMNFMDCSAPRDLTNREFPKAFSFLSRDCALIAAAGNPVSTVMLSAARVRRSIYAQFRRRPAQIDGALPVYPSTALMAALAPIYSVSASTTGSGTGSRKRGETAKIWRHSSCIATRSAIRRRSRRWLKAIDGYRRSTRPRRNSEAPVWQTAIRAVLTA